MSKNNQKAIIYVRVSSREQVKMYSLKQQREALREYCSSNNIEVIEEVSDEGYSGASLERPGLDRVRDLVETGGVDFVLAQDRDRISREPSYTFLLNKEFEKHNTRIMALNQRGDSSPEGQLTDGIIDQIAKFERAKTAERTRRGKLKKAKEGKIVGTGSPHYGYKIVNDYYQVVPEEMEVVTTIFRLLSEHKTIYEVATYLKNRGIKSPRGGLWHRSSIRPFVLQDVYKPQSTEELSPYVSKDVLSTLDPSKRYGICWYNKFKKQAEAVTEVVDGEKVYKTKRMSSEKPREEWIAIPVPDSGIPRETVDKARQNIQENKWTVSSNSERFWELSGGISFCGDCGCRMTTVAVPMNSKIYLYYRCSNNWSGTCSNRKHYRALDLETKAISALQDIFSGNGKIKSVVEEHFEKQIKSFKRKDPQKQSRNISERIGALLQKRSNAQDLAIDGLLDKEQLREKTQTINDEISILKRQLQKASEQQSSIASLERKNRILMDLQEFGTAYDLGLLEDTGDDWLEKGAKTRYKLYKDLGLKVLVDQDETILELNGDRLFSNTEGSSRSTNP